MSELGFEVTDVQPAEGAAAPTLLFHIAVTDTSGRGVQSAVLHGRVMIDPRLRRQSAAEEEKLVVLWGDLGLRDRAPFPLLLTQATIVVPAFEERTTLDLPILCPYGLEVAIARYLHALDGGNVTLVFHWTGSVFRRGPGGLEVSPVPWDRDTRFELPVARFREILDAYHPGADWVSLDRASLMALDGYRRGHALRSLDEALRHLLATAPTVEARS